MLIKYYQTLNDRHVITNYRWYKDIIYRHFPVLIDKKNGIRFLKDTKEVRDLDDDVVLSEKILDIQTHKRIREWAEQTGVNVMTGEISEKARQVQIKNREMFIDFCRKCKKCNIEPVIVISPFSAIFNRHMNKEFIKNEFEGFLKEIGSKEHIAMYNYRVDERFEHRLEYFRNIDCLNSNGAEAFTRIVIGDLFRND